MRSQPQTYTAPSDELRRCCDFFFFFGKIAANVQEAVILVLLNLMFRWHLLSSFFFSFFFKGNCNCGTLIHFVMNDWMSAPTVKSPRGKCCMSGCERSAVKLFHLFGNNVSSPDTGAAQ